MPQQLIPPATTSNSNLESSPAAATDALRRLSRSPHPYHRRGSLLTPPVGASGTTTPTVQSPLRSSKLTDDEEIVESHAPRPYSLPGGSPRSTDEDSGTEADDEHFLKGLPAPRSRPHKGLRGSDGNLSGSPSPRLSPTILKEEGRRLGWIQKDAIIEPKSNTQDVLKAAEKFRRKRGAELRRRVTEVVLLGFVGGVVLSGDDARAVIMRWRYGMDYHSSTMRLNSTNYSRTHNHAHHHCHFDSTVSLKTCHVLVFWNIVRKVAIHCTPCIFRPSTTTLPTSSHNICLFLTHFIKSRLISSQYHIKYRNFTRGASTIIWYW